MHQFYFGSTRSTVGIGQKIVQSIYESIPENSVVDNPEEVLSQYGSVPWLMEDIQLSSWNPEDNPVDFRKMSTPDTTFCLVMAYDQANPTECPINAVTAITNVLSGFSDHVEQYTNNDATAQVFLDKIEEGVQYHNFYFYEFSHGANYHISLKGGVTRDDFWNAIQNAQNRFIGIFDSCDSGSMLNAADPTPLASPKLMSTALVEEKESFIEYIARKFEEKKNAKARLLSTSPKDKEPMFQLWSATQENHYCWYYPRSSTVFANAINSANNECKDQRLSVMWSKVKALGSRNSHLEDDDINKTIPQRVCYGDGFDDNTTWI